MKKLVLLSAVLIGGTMLVAFTPTNATNLSFNDVTETYNSGQMALEAARFSEAYSSKYTDDKGTWEKWHKDWTEVENPATLEAVENVLMRN